MRKSRISSKGKSTDTETIYDKIESDDIIDQTRPTDGDGTHKHAQIHNAGKARDDLVQEEEAISKTMGEINVERVDALAADTCENRKQYRERPPFSSHWISRNNKVSSPRLQSTTDHGWRSKILWCGGEVRQGLVIESGFTCSKP